MIQNTKLLKLIFHATQKFAKLSVLLFYPSGDDAASSGLSEHSSDRLQPPSSKPVAPVLTVTSKEVGSEDRNDSEPGDDSELLTPSASESTLVNGKPITSQKTDTTSTKKQLLLEVCRIHFHCVFMYVHCCVGF